MKHVISKIKDSKGFIAIEVIFIAGALILLASVVMYYFNNKASDVAGASGKALDRANQEMVGEAEDDVAN